MTGPKDMAGTSRGCSRPYIIRDVFLFEAAPLLQRLGSVKIGIATSIREREWVNARIYPDNGNGTVGLKLNLDQIVALGLLGDALLGDVPL